jgi:hypothetical protein
MRMWTRLLRFASRLRTIENAAGPPDLPFRCGTMLLDTEPETVRRIISAWEEAEERYTAWVMAHPAPESDWLETVVRLRKRRLGLILEQMKHRPERG